MAGSPGASTAALGWSQLDEEAFVLQRELEAARAEVFAKEAAMFVLRRAASLAASSALAASSSSVALGRPAAGGSATGGETSYQTDPTRSFVAALQEELRALLEEGQRLQKQQQQRGGHRGDSRGASREGRPIGLDSAAAQGAASTKAWRQRIVDLEDELRVKAEAVGRLRQRELWLEHQLRRQADFDKKSLATLLSEVKGLQTTLSNAADHI